MSQKCLCSSLGRKWEIRLKWFSGGIIEIDLFKEETNGYHNQTNGDS